MKIAIFHNLRHGGGLQYITEVTRELSILNIQVDIYTHQNNIIPLSKKTYLYPLKTTKNIFQHIKQVLCETEETEKMMSIKIIKNKYNYIFVFPCHLQQCPNIVNFLPKNITYYFYLENIREFYEKTTFDYFNFKKILSRIIRLPIKIQDHLNCINTINIISDSYYSNYQLKIIYDKKSNIIQPGLITCPPEKIKIKNNHQSLSFGLLSMLKGHHISAQINPKVKIYGSKSHDKLIDHIDNNVYIKDGSISNKDKIKLYKKHTFYFANQINEPFGLTTLEACSNNSFVLGRNEAGTCEIINSGSNGFLYDINNIKTSKKIFNILNNKKTLNIIKVSKISWSETVNKILYII